MYVVIEVVSVVMVFVVDIVGDCFIDGDLLGFW